MAKVQANTFKELTKEVESTLSKLKSSGIEKTIDNFTVVWNNNSLNIVTLSNAKQYLNS